MKGFLLQLAIWGTMAMGLLAMIPEAEGPQRESTSYNLAMLDLAEAYKTKSPEALSRTVFAFGGSHLAYGLDSAQFSEAGLELANLGLNVGVGVGFPMDQIRDILHHIRSTHAVAASPAAIILSPPLPQIQDEHNHGEPLVEVLSAMEGGARWAWAYEGLPLWLQVKAKSLQVWQKEVRQDWLSQKPHHPQPLRGNLHRDILTGAGTIDSAYIRRDTVPDFLHKLHVIKPIPKAPQMAEWARGQRVPIFILPPPSSMPCDSAAVASMERTYAELASDCGGELLFPIHQGILPGSFFLEGVHLNLEGRDTWTQRIVEACRERLNPA